MRIRYRGLLVLFLLTVSVSAIFAQQRRGRNNPAPATPPAQTDLRITYRSTTSGQSHESSTLIKGKRQRTEMRMGQGTDIINITQCDLKRNIQVSDSTRKYVITPMQTVTASGTRASASATPTPVGEPVRRGGVVNYITTINDTGERKEMFGFTARHIKSSISIESSADACNPMKQRMETDGWYIDFTFDFDCDLGAQQMVGRPPVTPGGCRDEVVSKQIGSGRRGYPLTETTTMFGPDGRAVFTSTKEVLDLSREPLDAALFDVPAGYTETTNSQELYGAPSMASIMSEPSQPQASPSQPSAERPESSVSAAMTKAPGTLRVGVVAINNRTDRSVSLDSLRQRLIGRIAGSGIDAVPLSGISAAEVESEAKAKQCDFILYTDLSTLKISAAKKLGGFLGRAAGVSGIEKTESRVDFKLFAVGETAPRLQANASAKEEGDEASAGVAVDNEANKVSAEVRKKPK
jgi:hypothetical protein